MNFVLMKNKPVVFFALPVMAELDWITTCLKCIEKQNYSDIQTVICVNQPEWYRNDPLKRSVVEDNMKTLAFLKEYKTLNIRVIDCASEGRGWTGKKHGVGQARKTVMDYIVSVAQNNDIIISMDADTTFGDQLAARVAEALSENQSAVAISLPYYHRLSGNEVLDRAMLHYEIYMRYYLLNLFRIQSPYSFTALGSAMALPVKSYRAVKGIAPKLSGEDFYFLEKLRKYGKIILHCDESVYPGTRYSDRVFFGTGPALIKGKNNDWESYPIYSYKAFDSIAQTYGLFSDLFHFDIPTPMTGFLEETFRTRNLWQPIRNNFSDQKKFIKACSEKVDGLRILQFLKKNQDGNISDEKNLMEFLTIFHPKIIEQSDKNYFAELSFRRSGITHLDHLRNELYNTEKEYRSNYIMTP